MTRSSYLHALNLIGVMEVLAPFDPHVAGTPPLGIDLPNSDIDIICEAIDLSAFAAHMLDRFAGQANFTLHERLDIGAVVVRFTAHGWPFEIFGQSCPVVEQYGWRHFLIEQRLLEIGGVALRNAILVRRRQGLKTEPAFAALLGLAGDPYAALLPLADEHDDILRARISAALE